VNNSFNPYYLLIISSTHYNNYFSHYWHRGCLEGRFTTTKRNFLKLFEVVRYM